MAIDKWEKNGKKQFSGRCNMCGAKFPKRDHVATARADLNHHISDRHKASWW